MQKKETANGFPQIRNLFEKKNVTFYTKQLGPDGVEMINKV